MKFILDFKQLDKNDVALAGGKGASLGEMTQAGIAVPPGFVILSTAFEKFLEETDLNVEIDAILDSVNHKEIHTVENASEKIQALILQAEMPKDIADEIQKFFKKLEAQYVAVRSSATAEDSTSAAWAGQLESYLNTTEKNLLENVKKCWASLFTPRAIFYRFEKNLHKQKISVAVIVQNMVESEKSGIAFSVHPVTEDRNQLIIEAVFGLGEAIVSGQITPDSYVVKKQPRQIIDKNIQSQSRGLYRARKDGNEWRDIPKEQGEKQVLTDKEILELSEIILLIENHYGFPCDIEWASNKGKFYIVQSRPITTLTGKIDSQNLTRKQGNFYKLHWKKNWAGQWSLLECCYFGGEYTKVLKNGVGFGLKNTAFTFNNGNSVNYLVPQQLQSFSNKLAKKFLDKPSKAKEWAEKIKQQANKALKFTRNTKNKKLSFNNMQDMWKILDDYLVVNFPIKRVVDFLPPKILEKYLPTFEKARVYGEPVYAQSGIFMKALAAQLGKQTKLPAHLVLCMTDKELERYFSESFLPTKKELTERYQKCGLLFENGNYFLIKGKQVDDFENAINEQLLKHKTISGMSAYKGKVKGKVKIVFDPSKVKSFDKDTILVTGMTRPEYLPLMKASVAIVTDAGGILSHAAITARELKKPCIIGTEIATKVLKDGDLVEVDANKGIIRKLQ